MTNQADHGGREGGAVPTLMTQDEFDECARKEGPAYAAWEWATCWLKTWRFRNPYDEREDHEIFASDDYPKGTA